MTTRPDRTEAAPYYFTYIDQVPDGDVCEQLVTQLPVVVGLLRTIPDARSLDRYAPGKWTIREVVNHLTDCERLFAGRAFWFARGLESPLPSFDQEVAASAARADERSWPELIAELEAVRGATVAFFRSLPAEAWDRRGTASDNVFTVRACAFLCIGHVAHHAAILRERYLGL